MKALNNVGGLARHQGDYERAVRFFKDSLTLSQELGNKRRIARGLEGLAAVACANRQPEQAARLFGAAEALREAIGIPLPPSECADYDRDVAAVRAGLDEDAFAAAWAEGRAMPWSRPSHMH
ncbi:MAG: tetratricopeptide repeat protein [Candidatus Bipolaricaulia bacterium]